jgi:DNA-binding Xre family transcriptional regulator
MMTEARSLGSNVVIGPMSITGVRFDAAHSVIHVEMGHKVYELPVEDLDGLDEVDIQAVEVSEDGYYFVVVHWSGATTDVPRDVVLYHCEPSYRYYKGRNTGGEDQASRIGERIRELRSKRSLSITDLAQMASMKRPNLSRLEHGKHVPSLNTLDRIAEALGVPVADLVATK